MKSIILVDYENMQNFSLQNLDKEKYQVWLFIGKNQNRLPFDLVQVTQPFGESVKWIKIEGQGKNNLDFHIAFELGKLSLEKPRPKEILILSKDKGYDPLLEYAKKSGLPVSRIVNLSQLGTDKRPTPSSRFTDEVLENLSKIPSQKRPRTRKTLESHLKNTFQKRMKRMDEKDIETVIEELFINGKLSEKSNRLSYRFD
jgi:hypothetical protein